MTTKFEQLIEYVINDEEAKAKELFHEIVVEKSREIYENLMNEEEQDDEELDEAKEEDSEEEELDESAEEDLDEMAMMADDSELADSINAEEQGMSEDESDAEFDDEAEEDGEDLTHDMEKDHDEGEDLEDRVVDLEDKLDELMAEFESLMGDDGMESDLGGEEGDEVEGDAMAADDTMAFAEGEEDDAEELDEGIELTKVAAVKHGDDGANNKSVVAFNSGAAGMEGAPVKTTGAEAKGRPAPTAGKISNDKFQNEPATGSKKLAPAPKPHLAQAAGVNTKTPFPKG